MRLFGLTIIALAIAGCAPAAQLPPPLAPASEGKVQCYGPRSEAKLCKSIAAYAFGKSGEILNPATVAINAKPLITMKTVTPVVIKQDRVCGYIRPEDIAAAEFTIDGASPPADVTVRLREAISKAQSGMFGREICTAYVKTGDAFIAKAFLDGAAQPTMDQEVLWVSPSDGYSVSP